MSKSLLWMIDSLGSGGAEHLMPGIMANISKEKFSQRVCVLQVREGNPVAKKIEALGFPVDFVAVPNLRHPKNIPNLLRYLRQHQPDIVHTQLEFSDTLGNLATKLLKIPSVSTLHTLDAPEKTDRTYWRHQLMWASLRYAADRVISVSDSARQQQIRAGSLSPEHIITLYNGIDLTPFAPEAHPHPQKIREELDIHNDSFLMVSVAVLRKPKGIQYMLDAMPKILAAHPNAFYLVVGDGENMAALQEKRRALKLEKHVHFAGFRNDIAAILAASDLFVHPTLNDALPTVLIEAMGAEKALVASAVGGVPELLEDRVNGILIPPADTDALAKACLELIADPTRTAQMAKAGRKTANEKFSIATQITKLENLYEELISLYEK